LAPDERFGNVELVVAEREQIERNPAETDRV